MNKEVSLTEVLVNKEDLKAMEDVSDILKLLSTQEKERFLGIIQGVKLITIGTKIELGINNSDIKK
ncbi:MAG: hypothetical protein HFI34_03245 [Lachnospiraceae bacterium]|nr:hypothetical protein [Lachnospiraceae bacterium]